MLLFRKGVVACRFLDTVNGILPAIAIDERNVPGH